MTPIERLMDEGRIEKARKVLDCAIEVAQDLELAAKILGLTPSGLLRIMTRMEEGLTLRED